MIPNRSNRGGRSGTRGHVASVKIADHEPTDGCYCDRCRLANLRRQYIAEGFDPAHLAFQGGAPDGRIRITHKAGFAIDHFPDGSMVDVKPEHVGRASPGANPETLAVLSSARQGAAMGITRAHAALFTRKPEAK